MKRKYIILIVLSLGGFSGLVGLNDVKSSANDHLKLELQASKASYKLGEKIDFSFRLTNVGKTDLTLKDEFGTGTGFLHLECTTNKENEYFGCSDPSWGTLDIHNPTTQLRSGETISTSTSILWDWKIQDVPTYIFLKSGVYNVYARYTAHLLGENGAVVRYELKSDPVQVMIVQPQGEDLEVWNKIKDDGNFAYFMQRDEIRIPSYRKAERAKFKQKVEEILNDHPNSFYAERLTQSLAKFNAADQKRRVMIEKLKLPSPQ